MVYLVRGKGYYEVFKEDASFYDYNLDVNDQFPDSTEQALPNKNNKLFFLLVTFLLFFLIILYIFNFIFNFFFF